MRKLLSILVFTCACFNLQAQVNFVKNPGLEQYSQCPDKYDQIAYAKFWSSVIDTIGTPVYALEYHNECDVSGKHNSSIPFNGYFYQYAHSGKGMAGAVLFYDGKLPKPTPPIPTDYRDYLHGRLRKSLEIGREYCVTFYVNIAEASAYAHNMIGAYLDDGSINLIGLPPGSAIYSKTPQVFSATVFSDTGHWEKIEGSFVAIGSERYITIGNFAEKTVMAYFEMPFAWTDRASYYLIDDISVIPIDLPADAGPDSFVEETKTVQIGRVGDTTAEGLDCKWYHKGLLIDSGAMISVSAGVKGSIDTYVVVQTICDIVKTDTTLIHTVGLGLKPEHMSLVCSISPNPSDGLISIQSKTPASSLQLKIYDLSGKVLYQQNLALTDRNATLSLSLPAGLYLAELSDVAGNKQRERLLIR